jgi:hypothetical protein
MTNNVVAFFVLAMLAGGAAALSQDTATAIASAMITVAAFSSGTIWQSEHTRL